MKRDKFEELLKDKLDRVEVRPPEDMWARLEQRLPEIRRDLAFGGKPSPDAETVLPSPKIRRPLRRRMSWAYVAASLGAAAALVFTMTNLPDEVLVGEGDVIPPVTIPIQHMDSIPGDASGQAAQPALFPVQTGVPGISHIAAHITPPGDEIIPGISDPAVVAETNRPADNSGRDVEGRTETADRTETTVQGPTVNTQDNASDKRSWDGSSMTLEEWQRSRSRKSSRVSTSFFAMNSTGTNNPNGRTGREVAYYNAGPEETDEYPEDYEDIAATRAVSSSSGKVNKNSKHDLPITFGASVNIGITDRLSIETGLTYTYLNTKEEQTGNQNSNAIYITKRRMHYMGIPVKVKYDFVHTRLVDVYASAGGALETLVSAKEIQRADYGTDNVENNKTEVKINTGSLQASVGANAGVELKIDKTFGIYVEPGIGYFFKNGNQPESYRTENPLNFTIKAGVRVKL